MIGNNLKIAIALEELGLAYRLVKYDMYAGTHLTPEFRRINPNSKLPAIVDSEPADAGAPIERAAAAIMEVADRAKYTQARPQLTPQEWSTLFGDRLLAAAKAP